MKKIILLIFLITISCSNNKAVNNHGLSSLDLKANKIEISKTNKNDVLNIVGKPSIVSLFDENKWHYFQRESTNQSIFKLGKSKITKNNVLEITFNKYGIVQSKKLYNIDNMNDLRRIKTSTNKTYKSNSYIEKVLTSVKQKIDAPKLKRKKK